MSPRKSLSFDLSFEACKDMNLGCLLQKMDCTGCRRVASAFTVPETADHTHLSPSDDGVCPLYLPFNFAAVRPSNSGRPNPKGSPSITQICMRKALPGQPSQASNFICQLLCCGNGGPLGLARCSKTICQHHDILRRFQCSDFLDKARRDQLLDLGDGTDIIEVTVLGGSEVDGVYANCKADLDGEGGGFCGLGAGLAVFLGRFAIWLKRRLGQITRENAMVGWGGWWRGGGKFVVRGADGGLPKLPRNARYLSAFTALGLVNTRASRWWLGEMGDARGGGGGRDSRRGKSRRRGIVDACQCLLVHVSDYLMESVMLVVVWWKWSHAETRRT